MASNKRGFSGSRRNGIDHREIIKSHRSGLSSGLLALIQEKKKMKKAEEEERGKKTIGLAEDCTSCIFLWLSIDDLLRSSCVCKTWNTIITDQSFIQSHLRNSESGLLCLSSNHPNPQSGNAINNNNTFSVESSLLNQSGSIFQQDLRGPGRQISLHFLEIKDGVSFAELKTFNVRCSGRVLASCNGLVLLENRLKRGGLVVMNPVTRKLTPLPAGTIVRPNEESYGFAFKSSSNEHVAIHLFQEDSGSVSCEVLTIEKRKWAMVKGPPSGLFISLNCKPVFANGALHWLRGAAENDSILSLGIEDMKFRSVSLPKIRGFHDGIVVLGGFVCFVAHELNQIDIWVLRGDSEESWTKQHSIGTGVLHDMTPICGSKYGRWMIFRSYSVYPDQDVVDVEEEGFGDEEGDGSDTSRNNAGGGRGEGVEVRSLLVYDFSVAVMNKVRTKHLPVAFNAYMPHVNSLLSA